MMTTKKKIDSLKTNFILKKYPIILFCQHNNLTVTNWSKLRTNLSQIKHTKILVLKNSIIEKILSNKKNGPILDTLFQGPNFLIGCHNMDQLNSINKSLKSMSNVVFIGGLVENKVITHLDLEKLLQLKNNEVSTNTQLEELFFNHLNINNNLIHILKNNLDINIFTASQMSLIHYLNQYIIRKKKKKNNL